MGWMVVRHAFVMVFGNLMQAFRASLAPILIGVALTLAVFKLLGVDWAMFQSLQGGDPIAPEAIGPVLLASLFLLAVYLFVFGWVAVTWRRFILLEEYPDILPKLSGRPIGAYVGKASLIGLILFVIAIPLMIVFGLVMGPLVMAGGMGGLVGTVLAGIVAGTIITWFWYRYAVVLPATAVGRPMGIGEGWAATKSASRDIFMMCLIIVGINVAATAILGPIMSGMPMVGTVLSLAINWITLMVGASVLTTLYGHLVEGRPLVG